MREKNSQKYSGYLTYELFVSRAFRDLKPAARDILQLVYYEIQFMKPKKNHRKSTARQVSNGNDIKMPYAEISEQLGYSEKTIWSSFKSILSHGFLTVVEHGGQRKGNVNVYSISEQWRQWQPGQVISKIGTIGKIGFQRKTSNAEKSNVTKISSTVGKAVHSTVGKAVV